MICKTPLHFKIYNCGYVPETIYEAFLCVRALIELRLSRARKNKIQKNVQLYNFKSK